MELYILQIAIFILGFFGTYFMMPLFRNLLINSNVIRPNYRQEMIPVGMGIIFLPMAVINSIIVGYFIFDPFNIITINVILRLALFLFAIISMFFVGSLDDLIGDRSVSGLKGHFKSLLKGQLTTGGFKALFGGFVGLVVSVCITNSIPEIIVNTLVIALSTNFMNLFDLRPGRAIKVYLLVMIPIFLTLPGIMNIFPLLILPNVLAYFNTDLKARAMMGDTGSNVLGMSIGIMMAFGYDMNVKIAWLVFLVLIHLFTEKFSITKMIEKSKVLKFIDNLGR